MACAPGLACLVSNAGNPAADIPSEGFCNFEDNGSATECSNEFCDGNSGQSVCSFFGTLVFCSAFLSGNLLQPAARLA